MKKAIDHSGDAQLWEEDGIVHIDVRGLAPPQPMIEIIKLLEDKQTKDIIIMHHDREPVYLFPELAERNWDYEIVKSDNEFIIQLTRRTSY